MALSLSRGTLWIHHPNLLKNPQLTRITQDTHLTPMSNTRTMTSTIRHSSTMSFPQPITWIPPRRPSPSKNSLSLNTTHRSTSARLLLQTSSMFFLTLRRALRKKECRRTTQHTRAHKLKLKRQPQFLMQSYFGSHH